MARFFCENCGVEVHRDSGSCPSCGRAFDSVRCPQCGFTGAESLFKGGCPSCGYCAPGQKDKRPVKKTGRKNTGLPLWVYFFAALAMAAVILVLFSAPGN